MAFHFRDLVFRTHELVYPPAEDSVLLASNLDVGKGDHMLDVGTGTGIQAIVASSRAEKVLAVDINPAALKIAEENAILNNAKNVEFRASDLFSRIKEGERFDLIVFNPPYLPGSEDDILGKSWAGGCRGREVIDRFLDSVPKHLREGGRFELLVSSLNDLESVGEKFKEKGFTSRIVAKEKLWFEELYVILATKQAGYKKAFIDDGGNR